jgi:hypothetical protein
MSWGQWMVVEFSVEEELQIENQARSVHRCTDTEQVTRLCSSLVKQNAYYQKLLRQATGHIAELEMIALLADDVKSQCAFDDLDQSRQDDTPDQSLLSGLLLTVLSFFVACGFAVHRRWHRVTQAKNPMTHD